jgi:phosphoribosylformylglycinamidine (FGAM) synthase-like amidotransferase family enzyme
LRKTAYERGSLGRAKSAFGHAYGGREGDANPNGSANNIAGIHSENFRVLGLMPHPENLIDSLTGGTDGRGLQVLLCQRKLT